MNNPKKVIMVLVIAGLFLLPPAAVAVSDHQGGDANDARPSDPASAYPETSLAYRTNLAAMKTGQAKAAPKLAPVKYIANPEILDPDHGPWADRSSRGPRAGPDVYVAARGLSIITPDVIRDWNGAGVYGLKNADTQINVTINNSGDADATPVTIKFLIWDYFNKEVKNETRVVSTIAAGTNATEYFHWTPAYCTYFEINITLSTPGDTNLNNDQADVWNNGFALLGVALWADTCSATTGWNGDIASDKWHINTDPYLDNASQHTAPDCWYEGRDVLHQYNNNLDISARSPTLDFRNFGQSWFLHMNYQFHGSLPAIDPGDYFDQAFTHDSGASYDPIFAKLDGPAMLGSQMSTSWFNWYTDMNGDGQAQGNEIGLEVSETAGKLAQFRNHFVSNQANPDTGVYLDDFCIWGLEIQYDAGIAIVTDLADMKVNENKDIEVKITNNRQAQSAQFYTLLNVTKRGAPTNQIFLGNQTVNALAQGASVNLKFTWKPAEKGDYIIVVNITNMKDEDPYNNNDARRVHVSGAAPPVLIVEDNPFGSPLNTTDLIINTLTTLNGYDDYGVYYSNWKGSNIGRDFGGDGPSSDIMKKYDVVIWTTGWDTKNQTLNGTLTANDQNNLKSYLNAGGSLWLISMGAINDLGTNSFVTQTLHVKSAQNDTQIKGEEFTSSREVLPNPINGTAGSLADGAVYATLPPTQTNWSYDQTDLIQPDDSAQGVFFGNASGAAGEPVFVAVQYGGAYRVVFQTFDFGFIPFPDDRTDYVQRVLNYLLGGLSSEIGGQTGASIMKKMVDPGGTAVFTIFINNSGTKARTINNIDVGEVPYCWTAVVDPAVKDGAPATTINPGESQEITLTVTAPARALAGDRADLGINVSFTAGYAAVLFNRTITEVRAILKVELIAANTVQNLTGSGAASYPFTVRNSGNIQVVADLQKSGDKIEFFSLSLSSVLLQPFEEKSLIALMQVPEGAFRNAGNYTMVTTLTSRVSLSGAYYNSSLNFTTNVRVAQVFSAKIDDVELVPSDGLVDMSVAKPSAKVTVTVSSAKGNGYDNVSIELRPKSFAPTGSPSRAWDGTGWSLPKAVVDTTPFMTLGKQSPLTVFVPVKADAGEYTIEVRITPGSGKLSDGDTTTVVLKVAKPDVTFSGTISFNPKEPEVGTSVKIKVIVKNIGGAKAKDIDVAFYSSGDNLIQTEKISELAATTGSTPVEITWEGFVEGENQITVKIDPDSKLSEMTRENNEISDTLIGLRSDLQFDGAPIFKIAGAVKTSVKVGETVQIEVTVSNVGLHGVNLTGVAVQLTDSATGEVFTETIASLLSRSSAKVTFNWVAKKAGTHTMTIKVNPDGAIKEKDLTNNEASGTIKVAASPVDGPTIPWVIIGAVVGVVVLVAVLALVMMRRKRPGAPASAPVSAPPEETVAVVAEEAPGEPAK